MFKIVFTLDYEIHGNGDGSPYSLMIEPTKRLLNLFNKYGAKLTILADVAEILKFKEYFDLYGEDKYYYQDIIKQLQYVILSGHDVQLHIHSSYFGAKYENGRWLQNWETYNLAELSYNKIYKIVKECKDWLESNIRTVKNGYKCNVFRAANWSMMPSKNIITALIDNKIKLDTSVYKYGKQSGIVNYDYTNASDSLIPWFVDENNVCKEDKNGKLLECPIYCENRYFFHFITLIRVYRMIRAKFHKHKVSKESSIKIKKSSNIRNPIKKLFKVLKTRHPWKLDFNQATGKQLINAIKRITDKYSDEKIDIPIVLIGHSKTFIKLNEINMKTFLKYLQKNNDKYSFSLFQDLHLENYRF